MLQRGIPLPNILPSRKRRQLDGGRLRFRFLTLVRLLVFLVVVLANQMAALPVVNTAAIFVVNVGIHPLVVLKLDAAIPGYINLELFIKTDGILLEVVLHPELAGSKCRVNHRDYVVFEHLAGSKSRYGDVLLTIVCVNGCFALHRRAQVLYRILGSRDHTAIGLMDSNVGDFNFFIGGVISNNDLPPLLSTRFTLNFNARVNLAAAGSIVFEAVRSADLLENK